jgi:hypothetical protein
MSIQLEPITTLIKLAILNYKVEGTKLSIQNNSIFLQEPCYYQGVLRYLYSDSRNDLIKIEQPIKEGLDWISKNAKSEDMDFILKKSISGLLKLSRSYQEDVNTYKTILSISQIIQNFVYDEILTTNNMIDNIDRVWKEKKEFTYIKNTFTEIETILKKYRVTDLNEMYNKINTELYPIENILQRKDVLFISKLNNNYIR